LGLNPPTLWQFKHYRRTDGWTTDGRTTTMPKVPCSIAVPRQNSHITHSFNCLCEFFLRNDNNRDVRRKKKHFMNSLQYTGWAKMTPFIVDLRLITSPNINRF